MVTTCAQNELIRESLVNVLKLNEKFSAAECEAIALAMHPWQDQAMSTATLEAIAKELLPIANIRSSSVVEIAIDRLLRIADAIQFEGEDELVLRFRSAAHVLDDSNRGIESSRRFAEPFASLVSIPLGVDDTQSCMVESEESLPNLVDYEWKDREWGSLLCRLHGKALACQTDDLGIIVGVGESNLTLHDLAEPFDVQLPATQFDEYLDWLEPRDKDILLSRVLRLERPDKQTQIADRWNISCQYISRREAEISEQLKKRFNTMLCELSGELFKTFSGKIIRRNLVLDAAFAVAGISKYREALAKFVIDIHGPWVTEGEWLMPAELQSKLDEYLQSITATSDPYGFLDETEIEEGGKELFRSPQERDDYLLNKEKFGFNLGAWTIKNTEKYRTYVALRHLGRPATKEEINECLGDGNVDRRVTFEGIVRESQTHWGFPEWIDEPYEGIFTEVKKLIEVSGGMMSADQIVETLVDKFDALPSIVLAYLNSDAIIHEHGSYRIAGVEDFQAGEPSLSPRSVQIDGVWGQQMMLAERHFKGYSLGFGFDLAFANGLRPNDQLSVPINGTHHKANLLWRLHTLNRRVDVGCVADFLMEQGFRPGDQVVVVATRTSLEVRSLSH